MNMFRLWRLFHRSGTRGTSGRTSALAIVAFASATAVFLTVLGGPPDEAMQASEHG